MDAIRGFIDRCLAESSAYGPIPAWWWSGAPLEIGRMRWQMDQMHAMGIRQFVVINLAPSGTMFGTDPDDPPYMSAAWWTIFRQVCDYAQQTGMKVWFYDQIGFSGASYQADIATAHPEHLALQLRKTSTTGVGELEVSCPVAGLPIAAYAIDDAGATLSVPIRGSSACLCTTVPTTLTLVYAVQQGYDLLSLVACEKLLDTVHRQFQRRLPEHLGTTIVGSFQDELPNLPTWGPTFSETFAQRFGYGLEERIADLFEAGGERARRTRIHYHIHRASLAEEAFFKPFFEWHEQHGLKCGFDQQSPAREARVTGAVAKYADYMQTHQWYACPGSDLHGNGKLHASMAFLHKRPRVWLEGFHSTGWGGTIADTFDWMLPYLQQGVTLYNPHAIYYSTRKGWWEWAPPSTCWRQPYAMHYAPFAQMIERLLSVLSRGVPQATVGILFPTTTVQSAIGSGIVFDDAKRADETLHETIGSVRWHQVKTGALDMTAIDYLLLDEPSIAASTGDGSIGIHGVAMQTILLPAVTMLHAATLARLRQFAETGGRLISIGSRFIESVEGNRVELSSLPNAIVIDSAADLARVMTETPRTIRSKVPTLHRKEGDINILFIPASTGMATIVKWDNWFAPLEKATIVPKRYARSARVELPSDDLFRFDPRDGSLVPARRTESGEIDFEGCPFALLLWVDGSTSDRLSPAAAEVRQERIEGAWSCVYEPTLPTTHADIYDADLEFLRLPRTSTMLWTDESTGEASTIRATFGPRAIRIDPDGAESYIEYSPQFGIDHDKLHQHTLGPKAHVPDEFVDLGKLNQGESTRIRFQVRSHVPLECVLVVSANAQKSASVNGIPLLASGSAYRVAIPCTLRAGLNDVALTFVPDRSGAVRCNWCFAVPGSVDAMRVPDRLIAPFAPQPGTTLRFETRIALEHPVGSFRLKVSSAAVAIVHLDGKRLGRLGGFDPYRLQPRGAIYEVALDSGEHSICIEVQDTGAAVPILVDGFGADSAGLNLRLLSDSTWTVTRDGSDAMPAAIQLKQDVDGGAWHLYRRPHPLPATSWLDGRDNSATALDIGLEPLVHEPRRQRFEWTIPPGATTMHFDLHDAGIESLFVEGRPLKFEEGAAALGDERSPARRAILTLTSRQLGGAVFGGPVTYSLAAGRIELGDFALAGLQEYSGAMRLRRTVHLDPSPAESIAIDLGDVRGTVEAFINGHSAGVRFISPYRFDISPFVRTGENTIELLLTNTLANHMAHWSPTRCVAGDQGRFGIFGPAFLQFSRLPHRAPPDR